MNYHYSFSEARFENKINCVEKGSEELAFGCLDGIDHDKIMAVLSGKSRGGQIAEYAPRISESSSSEGSCLESEGDATSDVADSPRDRSTDGSVSPSEIACTLNKTDFSASNGCLNIEACAGSSDDAESDISGIDHSWVTVNKKSGTDLLLSLDGSDKVENILSELEDDSKETSGINPFNHAIHWNFPYDYIKVAILGVFLMPIRIIGIFASIILAFLLSSIGLWGLTKEQITEKPFSSWRRSLHKGMGFAGRCMMRCYGFHVVHIKGRLASPNEAPVLVVAPHSSFFDGVSVYWSGVPSLVSRKENCSIPFFGKFIDFTQPVYVCRENTNSRQATIQEICRRATSNDDWPQVMVFPEGTCTNASCLITFKPGAFYPGVPVQPIVVRYPNRMKTSTWTWDGPGALKLLLLTMCQIHNYCEIEYLPVYYPNEDEKKDAHLYAANVRAVMAKALGLPVMDYTFDDCRLMAKAKLHKLPPEIGLIEFEKFKRLFKLTLKNVEECFANQFVSLCGSNGFITPQDMAKGLFIAQDDPLVHKLFGVFDTKNTGKISFKKYLLVLNSNLYPSLNPTKSFSIFKCNGNGQVAKDDFTEILETGFQLNHEESNSVYNILKLNNETVHFDLESWSAACTRRPEWSFLFLAYEEAVVNGTRQLYKRTVAPALKLKAD